MEPDLFFWHRTMMNMTRFLGVLLCALVVVGRANATPVDWNVEALRQAPRVFEAPASVEVPEGVRAVCFEGPPWRARVSTRVFAYYGVPASATPEHPAPGIVLVHGAGGTAFAGWVKLWVDRGYAAIAFDNDAGLPIGKFSDWARNPEGGPRRGDITQLKWPVANQWMYHAVADTLLAHSLLASMPGVDAKRIGVTGISWGGVIVANVAAIDHRLKFAVPVYGCGFISEESDDGSSFVGQKGTLEQRAAWRALWDPANYLPQASIPMLWLAGTNDFAFTMKAWQRSYRAAPGTQSICLCVRMPHGHGTTSEAPTEILAFADSIVRRGRPLVQIIDQGQSAGMAWVRYKSATALKHAELNFTRDVGRWQDRKWETAPAGVAGDRVSAALPVGTTVHYFNLIDDRGLVVSSEHREIMP